MAREDTSYLLALVEEFGNGEDGKKYEGVVGGFRLKVHDDVGKADEERMSDSIPSHH